MNRPSLQSEQPQAADCSACGGSGWQVSEGRAIPCACVREKAIRRLLPRRYWDARLCDFARPIRERATAWLADPRDGLLLSGDTGTGKTRLGAAIVREQIERGRPCSFRRMADFYAELRETFRLNMSEADVIKPCIESPMIVLDDVGAGALSDFERRATLEVVDARLNALRPTILTTNLELVEIAAKLDDRIASRLASYEQFRLNSADWRLAQNSAGRSS